MPAKNIHCFEASDFNFSILKENHKKDGVKIVDKFVSNKNDKNNLTIDRYATNNDSPTIIKIDVEGAESKVLKGMDSLLEKHHPSIFLEVHPQACSEFNAEPHDILDFLKSKRYTIKIGHESPGEHFRKKMSIPWKPPSNVELPTDDVYLIFAR